MERRKEIIYQGHKAMALEVPFQAGGEHWNEYLLEDGSVIKMKSIATEVLRVENEYDQEGNPVYMIKATNVVAVSASDKLRKPPTGG